MWEAISYVTSGLTLVAFVVAVGAWVYKSKIEERERLIRAANPKQRGELVKSALEFFDVNTASLSQDHQYQIALGQIQERSRRFKSVVVAVCFLASVTALTAAYAICQLQLSKPASTANSDVLNPGSRSKVTKTLALTSPNGPSERWYSKKNKFWVQGLTITKNDAGKIIAHYMQGAGATECAGRNANDGPWLNIQFLDKNKNVLFLLNNVKTVMTVDAATIVQMQVDITGRVDSDLFDTANFVSGFMPGDANCGKP